MNNYYVYEIKTTKQFEKALEKLKENPKFNENELKSVIEDLANGIPLQSKYRDHSVSVTRHFKGKRYKGMRECHVQNDILLLYIKDKGQLILLLLDIGTHSELFGGRKG